MQRGLGAIEGSLRKALSGTKYGLTLFVAGMLLVVLVLLLGSSSSDGQYASVSASNNGPNSQRGANYDTYGGVTSDEMEMMPAMGAMDMMQDSSSSPSAGAAAPQMMKARGMGENRMSQHGGGGGDDEHGGEEGYNSERLLVRNGNLQLKSGSRGQNEFETLQEDLQAVVTSVWPAGEKGLTPGLVTQSNTFTRKHYTGQYIRMASFTARVPSASFKDVMSALKQVVLFPKDDSGRQPGVVQSSSTSTTDVTSQWIDADARAAALGQTRTQLMALMEKATNVNEVLQVQRELSRITSQEESNVRRRDHFKDEATMSTITLSVEEADPPGKAPPKEKEYTFWEPVVRAWKHLRKCVFVVVDATLYGITLLVPITIVALGVWAVLRSMCLTGHRKGGGAVSGQPTD